MNLFVGMMFAAASWACGPVKTGQLLGLGSGHSPEGLYEIDVDFGDATVLHGFTVDRSEGGLAVGPDGTVYAAFSGNFDMLVIVDPLTGRLTFVGPFGFEDVSGLAFGDDGTLYGYDDFTNELLVIDIDTGQAISISEPLGFGGNAGLAFGPDRNLYGAGRTGSETSSLFILDPKLGEAIEVGPLGDGVFGEPICIVSGLEFVGDTLFASAHTVGGYSSLYELDPDTGDAEHIGFFYDKDPTWSMGGLAFLPGAGDVDRDGDVDGDDYDIFVSCFTGPLDPGGDPLPVGCVFLDSDDDNDIDCLDWEAFIVNWTEDEEPPTFAECDEPPPCEGDANGDNTVDPLDAGFVSARFGCPVGSGDAECDAADQTDDGLVDPLDLGYVLARFGNCP